MLRPDAMPAGAIGSPAEELDTSCLNCFSRRVGLIAIGWVIVVMNAIDLLGTIELMAVGSGGAIAILAIYLLIQLVDITLAALLLLGLRDGVVRTRLNIWLVWTVVYTALLVLLFIIFVAAISLSHVSSGILSGLQVVVFVAFRVYCVWAGWQYREHIMAAPPPANHIRPESSANPAL